MNRYCVVDSSVAVKWFKHENEDFVAEAFDLLERHRNREVVLVAPGLLLLEVLNALRFHGYTSDELKAAAGHLTDLSIEWRQIDPTMATRAAGIAVRHGLTTYDASYAAVAREYDALLVTADRKLAESGACRSLRLGSTATSR